MKNPFMPMEKADMVIIDGRVSKEIIDRLKKLNLKIIPTIPCKDIAEPVSYHPDMVLHPINHYTLMVAPNVFDYYEDKLSGMGIKIIKGETKLTKDYPGNIAYNVGRIDGFAVHNFKYTDEKLKYYLKKENLEFVDVKQGYSKCSMAVIDERAIITADYPIYKELSKRGIDVLLIQPGHIVLEGYSYGFIGGATGNLSKDVIMISGSMKEHPDKLKIENFIKRYNKEIYWLSHEKIIDIGTIITLNCQ